jgi:hypothetical protein
VPVLVTTVASSKARIDTELVPADTERRSSDDVLAVLRPSLEVAGYQVESGKSKSQKITRPVLYGDLGLALVSYDVDAFHDEFGIALEVEAGRGASNNADYRDILRTALLLDAKFLALLMPVKYHFKQSGKPMVTTAYANTHRQLDAIYASQRLRLPFDGVLLVGY